jgi:hypothetical protein
MFDATLRIGGDYSPILRPVVGKQIWKQIFYDILTSFNM